MTLTIGNGPFGDQPAGAFNFRLDGPERILYLEDSPRWVRGLLGDDTVVSSRWVKLLHESGRLPVWYFPMSDVRMDLLVESGRGAHEHKGPEVRYDLSAGGREVHDAARSHPELCADHVSFRWSAMDAWFEEAEQVFVHPRDPYHRVDVLPSSRHVKVSIDGHVLAETDRPMILFETGLPPRYYIPDADVRTEVFEASDTITQCPYKGTAQYRSAPGDRGRDVAWYYPDPIPAVEKIAGHLAFFNERVDIEVDGEAQERPRTRWS